MKSCETAGCQDKPQQFNIMCIINDVSNLKKVLYIKKNQAPGDAWLLRKVYAVVRLVTIPSRQLNCNTASLLLQELFVEGG